jgi:hypothetical protein
VKHGTAFVNKYVKQWRRSLEMLYIIWACQKFNHLLWNLNVTSRVHQIQSVDHLQKKLVYTLIFHIPFSFRYILILFFHLCLRLRSGSSSSRNRFLTFRLIPISSKILKYFKACSTFKDGRKTVNCWRREIAVKIWRHQFSQLCLWVVATIRNRASHLSCLLNIIITMILFNKVIFKILGKSDGETRYCYGHSSYSIEVTFSPQLPPPLPNNTHTHTHTHKQNDTHPAWHYPFHQ